MTSSGAQSAALTQSWSTWQFSSPKAGLRRRSGLPLGQSSRREKTPRSNSMSTRRMNSALALVSWAVIFSIASAQERQRPQKFPLLEGLGDNSHKITVAAFQSQRFFDQGLRLLYAFNHDEAIRAFRAIEDVDPHCAMAQWGIAYALGPNYNLQADPERDKEGLAALERAIRYARIASQSDQDYIAALSKRYARSSETSDRKTLDQAYADAMRDLAKKHPDDLDAQTLYAEALMDLRPWDLWTADGKPQPGTEEIVSTLERVLAKDPNHPGANHYYIHVIEASPYPERGLASADRLGGLTPAAGHLVHMPAHIYLRLGRYDTAAECNRKAVEADRAYIAKCQPEGIYPMMYYPHNIHFLWSSLCFHGCRAEAITAADELGALLTEDAVRAMPMIEAFVPTRLFTLVRFGQWDDVLKAPVPPVDFKYSRAIWHYARGMALVETNRANDAEVELKSLAEIHAATPEDSRAMRHRMVDLLAIARATLEGKIAAKQGRIDDSIARLEEAVRQQDALAYDEPPPWYYPARQSLGAVLLAAGRAADAEKVYRDDLARYTENGWSLFGLWQALKAQKSPDADEAQKRFEKAWAKADMQPQSSEY
jgi:tetratricopeptide (TPR) repeat protein